MLTLVLTVRIYRGGGHAITVVHYVTGHVSTRVLQTKSHVTEAV